MDLLKDLTRQGEGFVEIRWDKRATHLIPPISSGDLVLAVQFFVHLSNGRCFVRNI